MVKYLQKIFYVVLIVAASFGLASCAQAASIQKSAALNASPTSGSISVSRPTSGHSLCLGSTVINQAAIDTALRAGHPYQISAPGNYCLMGNVYVSLTGLYPYGFNSSIIEINAVSGTIKVDLNGWAIEDTVQRPEIGATAILVAHGGQSGSVQITNGTVRNFGVGVLIQPPLGDILVGSVVFDHNLAAAVTATGEMNITLRGNAVVNSGNGFAISHTGSRTVLIENNNISLGSDSLMGFITEYSQIPTVRTAVQLLQVGPTIVRGNTINFRDSYNQSAIITLATTNLQVSGNTIYNARYGVGMIFNDGSGTRVVNNRLYATGSFCEAGSSSTTFKGIIVQRDQGLNISNNIFSGAYNFPIELYGYTTGAVRNNISYLSPAPFVVYDRSTPQPGVVPTSTGSVISGLETNWNENICSL